MTVSSSIICPECGASIGPPPPEQLRIGALTVDTGRHEVRVHGELRKLYPAPFKILTAMMRRPGVIFTHNNILDIISNYESGRPLVRLHIFAIRRAVGDAVDIKTHWWLGYSLISRRRGSGLAPLTPF